MSFYRQKRVLVTGGTGMIGRFVVEMLIEQGARVRVASLDDPSRAHPGAAFHSGIDDDWPIVQTAGFLSLVIPRFALGKIGFDGAYLAELDDNGVWREVDVRARIDVMP